MRKMFLLIPLLILIVIILMVSYVQHSCSDGTFVGDCSASKTSYYCNGSKNLVVNCELCGCEVRQVCINNTCV